jgi:hypothetical protein
VDVLLLAADRAPSTGELIAGAGVGAFAGAVLAALLTQLMTGRREKKAHALQRKGIARVLYQDFLRQQSTLARAFYRRGWWRPEELSVPQIDSDDVKFLATDLNNPRWTAVADALGWMTYLGRLRGTGEEPPEPNEYAMKTFENVYRLLDIGRVALADCAEIAWEQHDDGQMRQAAESSGEREPGDDRKLPVLDLEEVKSKLRG